MSKKYNSPENLTFSEEKPRTKKQLRNWWIKTGLLLALVIFSIVLMFTLGDYVTGSETKQLSFSDLLNVINYPFLALLLGVILLYIFVESSKYAWMLKISTGKFHFRTSVKTMFLGKYYDGITPLSTGGQPFQIYYLHKKDIPRGVASAIPLVRYIASITFMSLFSFAALILVPYFVKSSAVTVTLLVVSWVSLIVNAMLPLIIIFFTVFPGKSKRILAMLVHFFWKLHLIKKKYKVMMRCLRELQDYSEAIKTFARNIKMLIPLALLSMMEILLYLAMPFFVAIAIADVTPTWELLVQVMCLSVITRYTALLVPTPGNTGAVEATSSLVFVTITGIDACLGWVVLVWRFLTYYMYILSGIGINIFEIIRSATRGRRAQQRLS